MDLWVELRLFHCFFFNDTATTEIYTLSLHDALPIYILFKISLFRFIVSSLKISPNSIISNIILNFHLGLMSIRSEEHTSELQSRQYLVCRLLLEKKKKEPQIRRLTYADHIPIYTSEN